MQTSYREIWEEICFILSGNVNNGMVENVYEQRVIMALEKLGWSEFKKEIQTQKRLVVGRKSTIRPDIVLYGPGGNALVAIEVKRPSEKLASLEQLKSYMRQLKADFGLLVGHEIKIYYDGALNKNPEPLQLGRVLFDQASSGGQQFVELFTKANFLQEQYRPFLNKKISQFNLKREAIKLKKEICKPETKIKIIDFLKSEYSEISQDIVIEALKMLKIDIYYENKTSELPMPSRTRTQPNSEPAPTEKSTYLLTCKTKESRKYSIYIDEGGIEPRVIAPNGRFIPFDDRFELSEDDERIKDLLSSGKINKNQVDKYKAYQKSQRRSTKQKIIKSAGSPPLFSSDIPKKLSHILEMVFEMRKNGLNRIEATKVVANRYSIKRTTIQDAYSRRRIGKNTIEIDSMLQESSLQEFRSLLENRFTPHKSMISDFFQDLL